MFAIKNPAAVTLNHNEFIPILLYIENPIYASCDCFDIFERAVYVRSGTANAIASSTTNLDAVTTAPTSLGSAADLFFTTTHAQPLDSANNDVYILKFNYNLHSNALNSNSLIFLN